MAVMEYYANYGEFPKDNTTAGLAAPEAIKAEGIKNVTIMPQGRIVIHYTKLINPQAQASITLTPEGTAAITWTCTAQNIETCLLPEGCQAQ